MGNFQMNYYPLIKKLVEPVLTHYKEDLYKHDKDQLKGYTGVFIYAYRQTGTNLFLVTSYLDALKQVLTSGHSEYFTPRGLKNALAGNLHIKDVSLDSCAIFANTSSGNKFFVYGRKGKIESVTHENMLYIFDVIHNQEKVLLSQIRNKYYN